MLKVDGGGYSVDILLRGLGEGRRVVVEVDGPSHFVALAGRRGRRGLAGEWQNGSEPTAAGRFGLGSDIGALLRG